MARCIDIIEQDPHFLECVITGDETWVFQYEQSVRAWNGTLSHCQGQKEHKWASPRWNTCWFAFLIARASCRKNLCLSVKWLINSSTDSFFKRLHKRVMYMRPKIKNSWVLQHDYAHSHIAFSANPFLASKNIPVAPQPPYLPDLSTFDFFSSLALWSNSKDIVLGLWLTFRRL